MSDKSTITFTNAKGDRLDVSKVDGTFEIRTTRWRFKSPAALSSLLEKTLVASSAAFAEAKPAPVERIPDGYKPLKEFAGRHVAYASLQEGVSKGFLKVVRIGRRIYTSEAHYDEYRRIANDNKAKVAAKAKERMKTQWAALKELQTKAASS